MKTKRSKVILAFIHFCNDLKQEFYISEEDIKLVKKDYFQNLELDLMGYLTYLVPYKTIGSFSLSYSGTCGGWTIEKLSNELGGISCPFGYATCSSKEFVNQLNFAREVLRQAKENQGS